MAVVGDYAYVGDRDSGLLVISVADPANPYEVGRCSTLAVPTGISVAGSYACVTGAGGFRVISVSDPTHPSEVGGSGLTSPNALVVNGDKAYVGAEIGGLRVLSIADPTHPVEVGFYGLSKGVPGVAMAGGYVCAANGMEGLQIFQYYESGVEEISTPPVLRGKPAATVIRSLPKGAAAFDAIGRRVVDPRSGILFLRDEGRGAGSAGRTRKVVLQR